MNEKLLEQLRLAKEAGTKAMAKDFFAPTPGSAESEGGGELGLEGKGDMPPVDGAAPPEGAGSVSVDAQAEGLSPEQLEELLAALGGTAGGTP